MADIFKTLLCSGIGQSIRDLRDTYTIDQIYLMYEICKKDEMYSRKSDAIIMANAMVYASPSYDKSAARNKQRAWEKFIRSLDWERVSKGYDKKESYKSMKKSLLGLGGLLMVKKGAQTQGDEV